MTKLDGDARGGAALSVKSVTGVPIKFIGTGEQVDALEDFHPDRMAGRILGMGDVLTLVEEAQKNLIKMKCRSRKSAFEQENSRSKILRQCSFRQDGSALLEKYSA